MKKLLIVLMLWLGCFIQSKAQSVDYVTTSYIGWSLIGQPSWTVPSWYYCVTRSTYPDPNGNYWFDVWFYSNTYMWDYQNNTKSWRFVQLVDCKITYDGYYANYGKGVDISFRQSYTPNTIRFVTRNKNPQVRIYWGRYYTL